MPQPRPNDRRAERRLAALALAAVAASLVLGACANAQPAAPDRGRTLLEKVERRGSLAVIVRLAVPFRPEGTLGEAEARRQRAAIRDAQHELVTALDRFDARVATRFATVPLLALVVDEAALRFLLRSPLVRSVQENRPELPS